MNCIEVVMSRRSVRKFKPDQVDEQDLNTILEAGRWAPSAGNFQPWYFVVVQDEEMRKQLQQSTYGQEWVGGAPTIVVVCADPTRSSEYGERGMNYFCLLDCANATENMFLVAHALGYGACWVGGFREKAVKTALGLPEDFRVVSMIPLGRPDEVPEVRPRRELADIVRRDRW